MEESGGAASLKRRNSLPSSASTPITAGNHHGHRHHLAPVSVVVAVAESDFELLPLKTAVAESYTSLKDLLPASSSSTIMSPTPATYSAAMSSTTTATAGSGFEISIRNRLVKQAAWAYLQPAVVSLPSSSSSRICVSGEFLRLMSGRLRGYVFETATRVYDWLVDALWLIFCR